MSLDALELSATFLYAFHKGVDCICEVLLYKEIRLKMIVLCAELCTSMYVCERERETVRHTHSLFSPHKSITTERPSDVAAAFIHEQNQQQKVADVYWCICIPCYSILKVIII